MAMAPNPATRIITIITMVHVSKPLGAGVGVGDSGGGAAVIVGAGVTGAGVAVGSGVGVASGATYTEAVRVKFSGAVTALVVFWSLMFHR